MSPSVESDKLEEPQFRWGRKRGIGGRNKDVQFWDSFTYDGVHYALSDCVYMYTKDEPTPYIGKLVKIWESPDKSKKIKVHWFFRPSEISYYLKDTEVLENELFLASGEGIGLANLNPLEAVAGKCNVVCISTDSRNPQPSSEELQTADYVFYRIFDVKNYTISDQIGDTVGGLEVKFVFNKEESVRTLLDPRLDLNGKDEERNMIACKEKMTLAGENIPKILNSVKLHPDGVGMLEKEDNTINQLQEKRESSLGSSENQVIADTNIEKRSALGVKNVGCKVSGEKVKFEERVKSAKGYGNLDDTPSKRAKSDDIVSSAKAKDQNGVYSSAVPEKNAVHGKSDSELVKDSFMAGIDMTLTDSSGIMDGNMLKTSLSMSKEKSRSGHDEDAAGLEKDAKKTEDVKALGGKLLNIQEKSESAHPKDYIDAEKCRKHGENLSDFREKTSETNVVSPNSSSNSMKRLLKTNADMSKEKSNPRNDASHENKDATLPKDSCPMEGGPSKKAKFDDSLKKLEDAKNNTSKKLKEKPCSIETKTSPTHVTLHENKTMSRLGKGALNESHNEKKIGKLPNDNLNSSIREEDVKLERRIFEVTQRPIVEKAWIKLPWEVRLKTADDQGTLVLLQNLDPEYTSGEVEDIIWSAFKEQCTAKMVQHTAISNPHSGLAFVVFKTRDAVDRVVKKLDDGCLMLPNQRPLVASTAISPQFEKQTKFVGHLTIDKARRINQKEMKEAVSTSHYSQSNTIEYEMAMSWCLLQLKSERWWRKLYEQQRKEIKKLTYDLKSN